MKVLQLTTYPTINPRHGGQIRCFQIASFLRSHGHNVKSVAVYDSGYSDPDTDDIPFSQSSKFWSHDRPELQDYFSGIAASHDSQIYEKLKKIFISFKPDICLIESGWLFDAANKITNSEIPLIYSSQNIEWKLKKSMLEANCRDNAAALVDEIYEYERYCINNAAATIAVTSGDLEHFVSISSKTDRKNFYLAGNGVEPFQCSDQKIADWSAYFNCSYIVYVASGHPPNAYGFWKMLHPGLTFLKPNELCVVIGGVCGLIKKDPIYFEFQRLNDSRLDANGFQDKINLQAILKASNGIILPITSGEGSNLKTAEALEASTPIIATTKAMRGYEECMNLNHVFVRDEPSGFRQAVRNVLDNKSRNDLTPYAMRSKYYWKNQLQSILLMLEKLN